MTGAHVTAHRRSEPTISTPEILSFVTAYGTGSPGRVDVPQIRWPSVLEAITRRNLTGLSVAAVRAGDLVISGQQEEELFARHRSAMMHVLELERTLLSLGRTLETVGVRYTVLKGPALAHTMYPDPSWRPFSDLDLLVGGDDWPRAQELLAGAGFSRRLPEPRPGFDRRFGKAATHRNAEGLEVDLHRTLVLGPVGLWIEPTEMASHSAGFELGGRRFERLDDTGLLLNACVHATLGWSPPLPIPLRDIGQILSAGRIDWDRFDGWVDRWHLRAVVRSSFATAARAFGQTLHERARVYEEIEPSPSEEQVLRSYTTDRRRPASLAISTLRAIPGVRPKVAYARGLLLPDRAFLTARGGRYLRRWRVPLAWFRAGR
jgi:Uncharacterised nucleotidyltransferase